MLPVNQLALARAIAAMPGLRLDGVMGYEGHAVMIPEAQARAEAARKAMCILVGTRDLLVAHGIPVAIVSGGGSGTYDSTGMFPGVTEIQAGSYATMDAKYRSVGLPFENALTILSRVVGLRGDDVAITDGGLKTMTQRVWHASGDSSRRLGDGTAGGGARLFTVQWRQCASRVTW